MEVADWSYSSISIMDEPNSAVDIYAVGRTASYSTHQCLLQLFETCIFAALVDTGLHLPVLYAVCPRCDRCSSECG